MAAPLLISQVRTKTSPVRVSMREASALLAGTIPDFFGKKSVGDVAIPR